MISCLTEQLNGESCSSVAECLVTDAICNRGTCECPDTLYLQGTSCMDSKYCYLMFVRIQLTEEYGDSVVEC